MKKNTSSYLLTILGLLLLGGGLYLVKTITDPHGVMLALPYICVGIGCGVFGQGMGSIISYKAIKNNPDIEKQLEIERNDERNIAIGNRAKAKAYDIMISVFGALLLSFAFMGIDMVAILMLVFAYLFVAGYGIYYRIKYDKEM
jgi:drug/metabolite transporter (DMT)-like permease